MSELAIFVAFMTIFVYLCTTVVGYSWAGAFGVGSIDPRDPNFISAIACLLLVIIVCPLLSSTLKDMVNSKKRNKKRHHDPEDEDDD